MAEQQVRAGDRFVDVVVPLAMPLNLTYILPWEETTDCRAGSRVIVQVGKRRQYTGVVLEVHDRKPTLGTLRRIESVIDDTPVVSEGLLAMWQFVATYYMCTLGEVMAASLPAGLKLASKTRIRRHPDAVEGPLDATGQSVWDVLGVREALGLKDLGQILNLRHPQRILNKLLDEGFVITEEELDERYKPRMEKWVRMPAAFAADDEALNAFLDDSRARKQVALVLAYLTLATAPGEPVRRSELLKKSDATSGILRAVEEKGVLETFERPADAAPSPSGPPEALPTLSPAQSAALMAVRGATETPALLHGVTGSGKTEIYSHLIADALEAGQQVLFLVPEIALTAQLIARLAVHFDEFLSVYHSRFNTRERTDTWFEVLRRGKVGADGKRRGGRLVVGPRSALMLPFTNLGLIIIDEEHEPSFKQHDPAPRYHARDVALWAGKQLGAKIVLGSATPSVESVWLAQQGRIHHVSLTERFGGVMLPEIQCADLRRAYKQRAMSGPFSRDLMLAMEETLAQNRQVILFINRRGFAPVWMCEACAYVPECERCDVPLTHHKWKAELDCHHCGYHKPVPATCPSCGSAAMGPKGAGTERIVEDLATYLPAARVARMDLDTTRSKNAHSRLVEAFSAQRYDILVGTQMVTKGLDFAHVGLVGVISADRMLNHADFRSFERAYAMLTQVAGRAGRSGKRGKVILQTFNPDHWVLDKVMRHDFSGLVDQELQDRREHHYPPYYRLIRIVLRHTDPERLEASAAYLAAACRQSLGEERVFGPEVPPIARINDLHHRLLLLKFERKASPTRYKAVLSKILTHFSTTDRFKRIRVTVDVDPV
jgi:primosomal protein N' (replication factor Y)